MVMFTEEVQRRPTLDFKKQMEKFQNKYNNDKSAAKRAECKRLLRLHANTSSSAVERAMAVIILLNDRLDLCVLTEAAPWNSLFEDQRQWVAKWQSNIESWAATKCGTVDKAVQAVLKPMNSKNDNILVVEKTPKGSKRHRKYVPELL